MSANKEKERETQPVSSFPPPGRMASLLGENWLQGTIHSLAIGVFSGLASFWLGYEFGYLMETPDPSFLAVLGFALGDVSIVALAVLASMFFGGKEQSFNGFASGAIVAFGTTFIPLGLHHGWIVCDWPGWLCG